MNKEYLCAYKCVCVYTYLPICTSLYMHKCMSSLGVCTCMACFCIYVYADSCACICIHAHALSSRMHYRLEKPSPGQVPTFRVMPSSENLLQRALKDLVSSSASLGSSRSAPREALSARRSVPTSKRASRCSAVPSRGRI